MTSYEEFFGNYLKKADVKGDTTVTIKQVKPEIVGRGREASEKLVCYLKEFEKPFVLNQGNSTAIGVVVGSNQIEDWAGKQVVLYVDPSVKFGPEVVGGIRVRVPSQGVGPEEVK